MKTLLVTIAATLLMTTPAIAQLGGVGTSTTGTAGGPNRAALA